MSTNKILVSITVGTAAMSERYSKAYLDSATNEVLRLLAERFSGVTLVKVSGGYLRDDGTIVTELSYRFEVVTDNYICHRDWLRSYANSLTEQYHQECVLFTIQDLAYTQLVYRSTE